MVISYDKIPNKLFKQYMKVFDIRKAYVLSKSQKSKRKNGSPDIVLESFYGKNIITRQQLVKNFRYSDGSKIRLLGWSASKKYIVVGGDNIPCYGMYVPSKYQIIVIKNGSTFTVNENSMGQGPGEFLVCGTNPDGSINRDSAARVSYKEFKMMFRRHSWSDEDVKQAEQLKQDAIDAQEKIIKSRPFSPEALKANADSREQVNKAVQGSGGTANLKQNATKMNMAQEAPPARQYGVIGKLIRQGKVVGFAIRYEDDEAIEYVDKKRIVEMCSENKIKNVGVKFRDGKPYLYGKDVKLEKIPDINLD